MCLCFLFYFLFSMDVASQSGTLQNCWILPNPICPVYHLKQWCIEMVSEDANNAICFMLRLIHLSNILFGFVILGAALLVPLERLDFLETIICMDHSHQKRVINFSICKCLVYKHIVILNLVANSGLVLE